MKDLGQLAEALTSIESAIALDPHEADFYRTRALIHQEAGRRGLAWKDWQEYKRLKLD